MVLLRLPMMVVVHLAIRHSDIIGGGAHRRSERERQHRKRDETENPFHAFLL
jgi:hypothetical protein